MNWSHLHLLLNHVPLVGLIIGIGLTVAGHRRREPPVTRAGLVLILLGGILAGPVYWSGEQAESLVRARSEQTQPWIPAHENLGYYSLLGCLALSGFAAMGLHRFDRGPVPGWFVVATSVAGILVCVLLGWTAYHGAAISHPEIRLFEGSLLPPLHSMVPGAPWNGWGSPC